MIPYFERREIEDRLQRTTVMCQRATDELRRKARGVIILRVRIALLRAALRIVDAYPD